MRKLTMPETNAAMWLAAQGSFCPGDMVNTPSGREVKMVLDSLVKKKRALVEMGDDGPIYTAVGAP